MERKEIRGAVACLAYAAEVNEDDELATILKLAHAAILHNDTQRLVQHLATYDVMLYPSNAQATVSYSSMQHGLLECTIG